MSSDKYDHGPEMMIGGVILILALGTIVIKALKQFFIELGQSFEAFAFMIGSFTSIIWNTVQVVFLIALIISTVFCAIYFSIQYYQMVKEGTALREWTQSTINEWEEKFLKRLDQFEAGVDYKVYSMDSKLTNALKKPEVAPEAERVSHTSIEEENESKANPEANSGDIASQISDAPTLEGSETKSETQAAISETTNLDTKAPEVTMSNPY